MRGRKRLARTRHLNQHPCADLLPSRPSWELDHLTFSDYENAVRELQYLIQVAGMEKHRHTPRRGFPKSRVNLGSRLDVEASSGIFRDQDGGVTLQRRGQNHSLL